MNLPIPTNEESVAWAEESDGLARALLDLVEVIKDNDLISENVSYMQQAREVLEHWPSRYETDEAVKRIWARIQNTPIDGSIKYLGSTENGEQYKVPHSPNYVFREGAEPLAYQIWRSDEFDACLECGEDTERFVACPRCGKQVCPVCADDGHGDCIAAESAESLTQVVMDIARENSHGDAEIIIADRIRKYAAKCRKGVA